MKHSPIKQVRTPHGIASMIIVLMLGVVALGASVALLASSTAQIELGIHEYDASAARSSVWGCLDELLVHYNIDDQYAPTTIVTDDSTCNVTVTAPGNALITQVYGSDHYGIRVFYTTDPIAVTSITETLQ